jgi:hypothetical protein
LQMGLHTHAHRLLKCRGQPMWVSTEEEKTAGDPVNDESSFTPRRGTIRLRRTSWLSPLHPQARRLWRPN